MRFAYITVGNSRFELEPFAAIEEDEIKTKQQRDLFNLTKIYFDNSYVEDQKDIYIKLKFKNYEDKDFFRGARVEMNMVNEFYTLFNIDKKLLSEPLNNFYKGTFYKFMNLNKRHLIENLYVENNLEGDNYKRAEKDFEDKFGNKFNWERLSVEYYDKAIEAGFEHSQCYYMCAVVLARSSFDEDLKKAIEYLKLAIEKSKKNFNLDEAKSNNFLQNLDKLEPYYLNRQPIKKKYLMKIICMILLEEICG